MKCVCGYINNQQNNDELQIEQIEGEPFLFAGFNALILKEYESAFFQEVFVCPKCGTLKINIGE